MCVHAYVHACVHAHTHTHASTHAQTHTTHSTHPHARTHSHTHTHTTTTQTDRQRLWAARGLFMGSMQDWSLWSNLLLMRVHSPAGPESVVSPESSSSDDVDTGKEVAAGGTWCPPRNDTVSIVKVVVVSAVSCCAVLCVCMCVMDVVT